MKNIHIKNLFFFIFFLIIGNNNISSMHLSNNNPLTFNKNYFFPPNTINDNFLITQSSQINSTYAQYLAAQNVIQYNDHQRQLARKNLFITPSTNTNESLTRSAPTSFPCDICRLILPTKGFLIGHKKFYHNSNLFQCYKCPQAFPTSTELSAHTVIHSQNKKFSCVVCKHKYLTQKELESHQTVHQQSKNFTCGICSKQFRTNDTYKVHRLSCSNQRLFACLWCDKKFNTAQILNIHQSTHSQDKPFTCPYLCCAKSYKSNSTLYHHIKDKHSSEKEKKI